MQIYDVRGKTHSKKNCIYENLNGKGGGEDITPIYVKMISQEFYVCMNDGCTFFYHRLWDWRAFHRGARKGRLFLLRTMNW